MNLQKKIFYIIENNKPTNNKLPMTYDIIMTIIVLLSIASIILESYNDIVLKYSAYFYAFEVFSISVFTMHYILKIYTSPIKYKSSIIKSYIKFIFSLSGLVNFIVIMPFFLAFLIPLDMRFLLVVRLLRIFKFSKYFKILEKILSVIKKEKEALIACLFIICMFVLISAILVYYAEKNIQPQVFSSIPHSIWWAIITMSTVGYGDIYPISPMGKIIASIYSIFSIFLLAIPISILTSSFLNEFNNKK